MKTVKVKYYCAYCKFEVEVDVDTNSHGFFEFPDAYCPNDFMLLNRITDEKPREIE